jgi:hypothetical protein
MLHLTCVPAVHADNASNITGMCHMVLCHMVLRLLARLGHQHGPWQLSHQPGTRSLPPSVWHGCSRTWLLLLLLLLLIQACTSP